MGSVHNRTRGKWQGYGSSNATAAEKYFFESFNKAFEDTDFRIRSKPKDFINIYVDVQLTPEEIKKIYTPEMPVVRHGVSPDYAIDNIKTDKTIYVEVKRQDGWVEGGKRSDGRGNAHERSCKFFTPGLLKILRKKSKILPPALPFWTVFQGDITRDPCRVREITCWYDNFYAHFFFWKDAPNPNLLFKHFDELIAPLLESQASS
ncbi:MAG: MunI family type II restriction endonuclease [Deltaproteobacteria bacterium]|nr:MunI family type II restriction endonuclease [Deltaproteobacteria bacterium]